MQYEIDVTVDPPTVDGQTLVFYHFQGFKAVGPGFWDPGLDEYGPMNGRLRAWLYGGYLRQLRAAEALIRSKAPSASRSSSIRRPGYGWRRALKRLVKGQIVVSPRSYRL
jgi:hypothetical protein